MTLNEICKYLEIDNKNNKDIEISGINTLADAKSDEISFLENPKLYYGIYRFYQKVR